MTNNMINERKTLGVVSHRKNLRSNVENDWGVFDGTLIEIAIISTSPYNDPIDVSPFCISFPVVLSRLSNQHI